MSEPTVETASTLDKLREGFADPPPDSRVMMRWWWFGPDVERSELDRELVAMAEAGFGGVEVSYVYPLSSVTSELLSEDFLAKLRFAAERARELGLRFDLTLGSGWSFGGPHITQELAAKKLHWERREILPGAVDVPVVSPWPGDELVAAFVGAGSVQEPPDSCVELPVVDGVIRVPAAAGPRQVLLGYVRLTGQHVKRAAAGAEGPVLDHYSTAAAEQHLRRFADPLIAAVPPDLVGSVFCDSLEVYGADWTPELPAEFERRRGYALLPRLYQLVTDGDGAAELRRDFYRTLTELYEQNFVAVFQRWAAGHGLPFRIQGYGSPPATVSSYRFADLYEGEGWGWKEVTQTRWASSAAHLYGLDVVSSEVWTWVHSPSFRATPLDLLGEAHEHFLAGVNQLVGHGWPYSPVDAPGLGWFFYAAGALDDRNPWWPAMPQLNGYLHRLSWLLRQGQPVTDVKLYVPTGDISRTLGDSLDLWRETKRHIGPEIPRLVREAGLDFDLVDDDAVAVLAPEDVGVLLLPDVTTMPETTRSWLAAVQEAGGVVVSVGGSGPADAIVTTTEGLAATLAAEVEPDVSLRPPSPEVGVLHRRTDGCDVYFLANTGNEPRTFSFAARATGPHYEEWSPRSGTVLRSGPTAPAVEVTLQPYQSTVLVTTDDAAAVVRPPTGGTGQQRRRPLDGDWLVSFHDEASPTDRPVSLPHRWEADPDRAAYSGGARYRTSFSADPSWLESATQVGLDFGPAEPVDAGPPAERGIRGNSYRVYLSPPVREVAVVSLNGVECGRLWAPPYVLDLTGRLHPGTNELEVDVYNTAANALSADSDIDRLAAESSARYGRRFRMQDLDLALESVSSGLLAVPSLTWTGTP